MKALAGTLCALVACGSSQPTASSSAPVPSARAPSAPARVEASGPTSASAAAPAASAKPASQVDKTFPVVAGTRFTFRGKTASGKDDTWSTDLVAVGNVFQYKPHNDIANWFSKAGLDVTPAGIVIVGESLDGPGPPPALAIAFPFKKGTSNEVPGLFPCVYTVVDREKVTVPAGSFDAWKVLLKDKVNPEGAVWIAPGTGLVKIQLPSGRIDELVSIQPPG